MIIPQKNSPLDTWTRNCSAEWHVLYLVKFVLIKTRSTIFDNVQTLHTILRQWLYSRRLANDWKDDWNRVYIEMDCTGGKIGSFKIQIGRSQYKCDCKVGARKLERTVLATQTSCYSVWVSKKVFSLDDANTIKENLVIRAEMHARYQWVISICPLPKTSSWSKHVTIEMLRRRLLIPWANGRERIWFRMEKYLQKVLLENVRSSVK